MNEERPKKVRFLYVIHFTKEIMFLPVDVCWLVGLSAVLHKNC